MITQKKKKDHSAFYKAALCIGLSFFYMAMLVYPLGVTESGYMAERAFLSGALLFLVTIPVWIITIRREFFGKEAAEGAAEESQIRYVQRVGQLAHENNRLSTAEVKQMDHDGKRLGPVPSRKISWSCHRIDHC